MKKHLALMFFSVLSILLVVKPVFSVINTSTTLINVTISTLTAIEVSPPSLNWTVEIYPGSVGEKKNITIRNVGSVNVSQIHAYIDTLTTEPQRPYGTQDPSKYSAGGLVVIHNETDSIWRFVGRIEWNWTSKIPDSDLSAVTSPASWGFFRNTTYDYMWVAGNGTDGFCNGTNAEFAIEDDQDDGTIDTRTPTTTSITYNGGFEDWGIFTIGDARVHSGYCVAVYYDCTKIYFYRYDRRSPFSNCGNSYYLTTHEIAPGEFITIPLRVFVPRGIPAGDLTKATLTIEASSA